MNLVWKGKVVAQIDTPCEFGDYLCDFACDHAKFRARVCGKLLGIAKGTRLKEGDAVEMPMQFVGDDDKVYDTGAMNTPYSKIVREGRLARLMGMFGV